MDNKLFYYDSQEGVKKTYTDLLSDIQKEIVYTPYCRQKSYYSIFKHIITSLLLDKEVILLDSDFTDNEVKDLIGDLNLINSTTISCNWSHQLTITDLQNAILNREGNWKVTLFTSGTTGLPKKVSHSLETISRFVKMSEKHKSDVWGFAYNPTHMAGMQVFFQALLNFNPMIRLFGIERDKILSLIEQYKISNLSATPTFYRLLLPADRVLDSVKRITSGGEKFDDKTLSDLQNMFVNAKITNVYASTEAGTLFASQGDVFTIKDSMKGLVRIKDNELFLHKSLMGNSEAIKLDGDWYATGDLITVLSENPFSFKFVSRKNEMINVGGYKVNPTEVESVIRTHEYVEDVYVYAKHNRILGNVVCCEVVSSNNSLTEKDLRNFLSDKLQEFKIPRMMKFVEKLNTTRSGKIARNQR